MKEQLISFETAKLAKEKGFDEECRHFFEVEHPDQRPTFHPEYEPYRNSEIINGYGKCDYPMMSAPTQSLLQKWLREVHKISVESTSCWWDDGKKEFEYNVYKKDLGGDSPCSLSVFKTYEEALETGLQEALKLIEIFKK
jgi:hypothetical protein